MVCSRHLPEDPEEHQGSRTDDPGQRQREARRRHRRARRAGERHEALAPGVVPRQPRRPRLVQDRPEDQACRHREGLLRREARRGLARELPARDSLECRRRQPPPQGVPRRPLRGRDSGERRQ